MQINPYLTFNGDCEAAFKFYERVLGAKIESMINHENTPMKDQTPKEWLSKIMHAKMTIGNATVMGSDAPPEHYQQPKGFSVSLHVESAPEADRLFQALTQGGKVIMPIQETFWAVRFGMLEDRFGIPWMVNCQRGA